MKVVRCEGFKIVNGRKELCGNILYEGEITEADIRIKCHKCKEFTIIKVKKKPEPLVLAEIGVR